MINFNGNIVNESNQLSNNRGFLFGDAVFETLRVISNHIPFWEDHYFRLMASMRVLRFNIPDSFTPEFLKNEILKLHSKSNLGLNSRIRITVYRNSSGRYKPITNDIGYIINIDRIENSKYFIEKKEVKVDLYKDYFISNQLVHSIKSNNKSINVLASIYASENDLDNCILLNDRKMVCEFINGNLFYIKNEKIYTPDLKSGCLNGVLRKNLINIIKSNGLVIEESQISPFDLVSADELFITNVIQGILPVTNYRKKIYVSKIATILTNLLNDSINYN
jgi:branched-chain amino acid aminotransferase